MLDKYPELQRIYNEIQNLELKIKNTILHSQFDEVQKLENDRYQKIVSLCSAFLVGAHSREENLALIENLLKNHNVLQDNIEAYRRSIAGLIFDIKHGSVAQEVYNSVSDST